MRAPQNSGDNEFAKHPAGWALLVCTRVIDVGTHWDAKKEKDVHKIMLAFESEKLMPDGDYKDQPFLLFANFNYSMYQNAHLCKFIESWRGQNFDSQDQADNFDQAKLLGQKAYAQIVHNGQYVNIQTIGRVPEGMTAPSPVGDLILIDQDDLKPEMVEKLSDKMKARVLAAKEQHPDSDNPKAHHANTEDGDPGNTSGAIDKAADSFDDFDNEDIPF